MKNRWFVTVVLMLLCCVGLFAGFVFMKQEWELDQKRQQKVAELAEGLMPLDEERREWEIKEKEWQESLVEKQKGKSCILLNFDNMSDNLYDTIYDMMDQYGFRGTFAFQNGRLPGDLRKDIYWDEYDELIFSGWEYALSVGEEYEYVEDTRGYWERKQETETEEMTEAVQEEEQDTVSYRDKLEQFQKKLVDYGMSPARTLFCTEEQLAELKAQGAADLGFTIACVKQEIGGSSDIEETEKNENSKDIAVPLIGEAEEPLWRIDCGIYTQAVQELEKNLGMAIARGESVAIYINDVNKLSQDDTYDLSISKFTSLLNFLKGQEEEGNIYMITYSELEQIKEQERQEYNQLLKDYKAFQEERKEAEALLDQQETELVRSLMETESETTWWGGDTKEVQTEETTEEYTE